jgi:hypothetical protein
LIVNTPDPIPLPGVTEIQSADGVATQFNIPVPPFVRITVSFGVGVPYRSDPKLIDVFESPMVGTLAAVIANTPLLISERVPVEVSLTRTRQLAETTTGTVQAKELVFGV